LASKIRYYSDRLLVSKLRAARERKRAAAGKCEGRKSWAEINPELGAASQATASAFTEGPSTSLRDVA
jgi:hypothetical protein